MSSSLRLCRTIRPQPSFHNHLALQLTHCNSLPSQQPFLNRPATKMTYSTLKPDPKSLSTPERCYVDFCLVPIGTATASVANEVADVQRLLKASGLTYTMHSAGTTVEGSWDEVMRVVGQAHVLVHASGALRVQSSIRAGTRTDKQVSAARKVERVQQILAKDGT